MFNSAPRFIWQGLKHDPGFFRGVRSTYNLVFFCCPGLPIRGTTEKATINFPIRASPADFHVEPSRGRATQDDFFHESVHEAHPPLEREVSPLRDDFGDNLVYLVDRFFIVVLCIRSFEFLLPLLYPGL